MNIAFIGLGNMGGGMAANLVKAGHAVTAFDRSDEAARRAQAQGCAVASSAAAAVRQAGAVVTMLPNGAIVEQVHAGEVIGHAPPGALLLDCSTIAVTSARALATAAAAAGHAMVDAPVSGGIAAANGGTLTFMVGGTAEAFAQARPILAAMGQAVIHAGPSGSGQAAKICNNLLLGATMIATCETFRLAERLGLDPRIFYDIASRASGQCWSMTSYCPLPGVGPHSPADQGYQGGFAAGLMLKDLQLALDAAAGAGAEVPMGARARELYAAYVASGHAAMDFSGIIETL